MRVAAHPPTTQPQTCRKCSVRLPADHFAVAGDNRTGRRTQCRACLHHYIVRRRAALPPPVTVESKRCLDCGETMPAADFSRGSGIGGLQPYCRPCDGKRATSRNLARAPPQQPPPEQLLCVGPCGKVKPSADFSSRPGSLFGVNRVCKACDSQRHAAKAGNAGTATQQAMAQ